MTTMWALFEEGVLLPFKKLRLRYDLPHGHFLLHKAITAAIRKHWSSGIAEPPGTAYYQYMLTASGADKAITCL
ncbi:hypothetical protein NDU88_004246 [Pleurodeles waltl]|uniref:Uncharacterized protein n=1 Tax=Pleurodeles waltl TaxID=8319 RepID=A0AAV7QCE0_PLEWA|nr:hypothetical protein NDU88_004246 [Pleurodeles waltl]